MEANTTPVVSTPDIDEDTAYLAESYWMQQQEARFSEGALYMLSDMNESHYRKMIAEVVSYEDAMRYVTYKPIYCHLPKGKKLDGFAGYDADGKQLMYHQLDKIVSRCDFCDWLDYNGFLRPKWMPNGKGRLLADCLTLISNDLP